jgi:23S rRNA pseudouridine1911/1915/1917 synthase
MSIDSVIAKNASTPDWVICEDGPLLAVNKPAGIITEGHGDTVAARVKQFLKSKYQKDGNVYLGIPHRLDRDTTGAIVFTRNSKTAARVSQQFRDRTVSKSYLVLLEQVPVPSQGVFEDWLIKDKERSFVEVSTREDEKSREARLSYQTLHVEDGLALVQVELHTGRTHQIRVQFASRGFPVLGDLKYGGTEWQPHGVEPAANPTRFVALHSVSLQLKHPIRYDDLIITAPLPSCWPEWTRSFLD